MADTLDSGAVLHYQPIAGDWGATVPVPAAERQQTETCEGPEHKGKDFHPAELYVYYRSYMPGARYRLFGPNLRQDGSEGKYTLVRTITRASAAADYPAALAALDYALAELAHRVMMDAAAACAEITATTNGDTP